MRDDLAKFISLIKKNREILSHEMKYIYIFFFPIENAFSNTRISYIRKNKLFLTVNCD